MIAEIRQWVSAHGRAIVRPVIIVSYETLRSLTDELGDAPVGLLLCDEAHRLKNANNQTYTALNSINVQRRVLLTGTPIQNDLTEYFALLDFAIPGCLGNRASFKKDYENVIMKGRNADASEKELERCQEKLRALTTEVNKFVIRRTNDLLTKYRKFARECRRDRPPNGTSLSGSFRPQYPSSTSTSSSALSLLSSLRSTASSSRHPRSSRSLKV